MTTIFGYTIQTPLFNQINPDEIKQLLKHLSAVFKKYKKNEIILLSDSPMIGIGLILKGSIQLTKEDIFGNCSLVAQLEQGELFGEAIICSGRKQSPVTITAMTDTSILFLDFQRIINTCSINCTFHTQFIQNMLQIMAQKTVYQNYKIEILSKRSIHERICVYLSGQIQHYQSKEFQIPFNRAQLAEFLCVDRSALSKELGKMKAMGMIQFQKNHFQIFYLE